MSNRIDSLLAQMTLEEKVSLLAGADHWHTVPVPRLGIPALKMTDGPIGARGADGSLAPRSACFPAPVALSATWNPELIERVGQALGQEARAKGAQLLLGPTVNLHRSPLAGRNFECYSEDPYLAGRMAAAYIRGVQSQGVGACIKHFVCNDSEFQRMSISSNVAERPLRELYLRPFEFAVHEARPWAVMSAYNKINGVYASENDQLLRGVLKDGWDFDGVVVSDWFGTYSEAVVGSGLDIEMPGPVRWMAGALEAIRSGVVAESVIDDKVRRILTLLERTGRFEQPELQAEQSVDRPEHRRLARQAAAEAIVLLKNQGGLLPLDPARIRSIAVIGENAQLAQIMGGGSAAVTPHYAVSPLDGIRQRAGAGIEVRYAPGCAIHRMTPVLDATLLTARSGAHGFDVELFDNLDLSGEPAVRRFVDRPVADWHDRFLAGVNPNAFSLRISAQLVVPETGRYTLGLQGVGAQRLFIDGALVADGWTGRRMDTPPWSTPEVTGEIELQAGRRYALTVEQACQVYIPERNLRVGCLVPWPADPIAEAVALAARSDVAILVAGLTSEWESEGFDRPDMQLPGAQAELIARVAAANANTVVVLNAGSPLAMPWLDQVPAALQAWYGGQEAGHALADVLFGDVNPSGRLPLTLPRRLQDNPAYLNYPGENGEVLYGEGLFIGYRYYDRKGIEPLFPFGHGLSYTSFAYRSLMLGAAEIRRGEALQISVEVANTGTRAGQEVVQLYVRDVRASLVRPDKELKAFAKVALAPGEARTISLTLDARALAFYAPTRRDWVTEPGQFEVLVGRSARDILLTAQFEVKAGS